MSSSPGVPRSTMKARCPARPALRSTVAQTTIQSARIEFEMKVLAPFSTHASPARTAVVWMAATSLPAPGSVMAKAAQCGRSRSRNGARKRSFCSGVPMQERGAAQAEPRHRHRHAAVPVRHLLGEDDAAAGAGARAARGALLDAERLPDPHPPREREEAMVGRHRLAPPVRLDAERAEMLAAEAADLAEPRLEIPVDGQVDHASEDR